MNLRKITGALKQLDEQHNSIKYRYSTQTQTHYVYQNCLVEDQEEDRKVYGHTHTDTILNYKKRVNAISNQIPPFFQPLPQKKNKENHPIKISHSTHHLNNRKNKVLESFSAHNSVRFPSGKKKQLSFITSAPNVEVLIKKESVLKQNLKVRRKCEKKFQKHFIKTFQENIEIVHDFISTESSKNKIQITKSNQLRELHPVSSVQDQRKHLKVSKVNENINELQFGLTQINDGLIFERLSKLLFDNYPPNLLGRIRNCGKNRADFFKNLEEIMNVEQWSFYFLSVSDLKIYQMSKHKSKESSCLQKLIDNQKILHFYIVKQGLHQSFELVYEEFMVSKSLSLRPLEWPREIFRYFIRRLMMLTQTKMEREQVLRQEKIIFQEARSLPAKFYRFIYEMKLKPCIFVDYKLSQNVEWLHMVLEEGLSRFEARRLAWERKKGVRLGIKDQTNENKQPIYFYICSFYFASLISPIPAVFFLIFFAQSLPTNSIQIF